jgi:hypothetical protein
MSRATSDAGSGPPGPTSRSATDGVAPTLWAGWIMFGSLIMMLLGVFHVVQGLVGLFKSEYFLVGRSGLAVEIDYTAWGWIHLVFGAVALATGFAVLFGQMWARVAGVVIAFASAVANLASLAAYPVWSLIMIVFDVLIIWALIVHGNEMKAARERAK